MAVRFLKITRSLESLTATGSIVFLLFIVGGPLRTSSQEQRRAEEAAKLSSNADVVARGKYLVEDVAFCGNCHTPRGKDGEPDRARWLEGAPVFLQPAQPVPDWPIVAPRLGGLPPRSVAGRS